MLPSEPHEQALILSVLLIAGVAGFSYALVNVV